VAGTGVNCDRHRPVPGGLVARPLALAAADRASHRPRRLLPAQRGRVRAGVDAAGAEPSRRFAAARPQFRLAPSAGHRHGRRDRGADARLLFARTLARPYRTRATRDQNAQSGDTDAAARVARPVRRARLGGGAGGRDILRCRRRTDEACRCRVRLAGRDDAGQFPHRCLGEPAALYRAPAGDPAGPAAGAGTERRRPLGAGGKHAGHPRDRNSPRRGRKRGACRAFLRGAKQQRQGHRGAALRDQ
jgi:hypothetical protein